MDSKFFTGLLDRAIEIFRPGCSDKLSNDVSASADNSWTVERDLGGFKYAGVQVNGTGLNASDGVIKVQDSIDGENFVDINSANVTLTSGDTSNIIHITNFAGRYLRVIWTKGANSEGTLDVFYCAKR